MIPPPPPIRQQKRPSIPPPPPPSRARKSPQVPPEPEGPPPISPDLSRFDLEYAIWVHGGYPQVPWPHAVKVLLLKCRKTSLGQICAAAIDILDKRLPAACDLTADRDPSEFDIETIPDRPDFNDSIKKGLPCL